MLMDTTAVRERLAGYAHEAWAGWMQYLFAKSQANADGTVTIPAALVERWQRQMTTPYSALPAAEQESDRAEADKMLTIREPWAPTIARLVSEMQAAGQAGQGSRELSLAITKLQEAGHWLSEVRVPQS